jgi:hypothetical protein
MQRLMKVISHFREADTIAIVSKVFMVACRLLKLQGNHHQHQRNHEFEKKSPEFLKNIFEPSTISLFLHTHIYICNGVYGGYGGL